MTQEIKVFNKPKTFFLNKGALITIWIIFSGIITGIAWIVLENFMITSHLSYYLLGSFSSLITIYGILKNNKA